MVQIVLNVPFYVGVEADEEGTKYKKLWKIELPNSILTDCEAYGMVSGCDKNCPVLIAGKCELKNTDNKDLYELAKETWL